MPSSPGHPHETEADRAMDEHNTKIIRALDVEAHSAANTDVDFAAILMRVDADIRCLDLQVEVRRLLDLQTDVGYEFTQEDADQLTASLDAMVGPLYGAVSLFVGAVAKACLWGAATKSELALHDGRGRREPSIHCSQQASF
jgi:hypothetical protein